MDSSKLVSTNELHKYLEAIIEASFDGIWICDGEGKTLQINRAAARFSGVTAEQVVGRPIGDLVKEGLFNRAATLEVLEKQAPITIIQETRAGYRLLTTGTPIFGKDGKIELVFTNERDISELARMKTQIESSVSRWRNRGHVTFDEDGLLFLESHGVIARSDEMYRVLEACQRAAKFDISVLLSGESGAGKSVLAKFVHRISKRAAKPFIRINCGSIPETLMEAELFGYERGAFTGALSEGKKGLIEAADGGTLFLDEVGELSLALQVKLLAFLDDGEVMPIGATRARKFDVRIIAASNRDLAQLVTQRQFREELWFRLNVVPIEIPPLRKRPADIPYLIHHFLVVCNRKFATAATIHADAIDALCQYSFPGNVRELRNIVERVVVTKGSEQIRRNDLPRSVLEGASLPVKNSARSLKEVKESIERQMLIEVLNEHGSQSKAAEALGLDQSSISRKIRKYKLREHYIVHQS
ncbi:MAG TPA: sigma 54-interacting transcriptional regulator [Candidatus Binataceae bacterium]|nr:sigma 54-interacting transcriptional regulator [Candidatus Binataceae bacterium]